MDKTAVIGMGVLQLLMEKLRRARRPTGDRSQKEKFG